MRGCKGWTIAFRARSENTGHSFARTYLLSIEVSMTTYGYTQSDWDQGETRGEDHVRGEQKRVALRRSKRYGVRGGVTAQFDGALSCVSRKT